MNNLERDILKDPVEVLEAEVTAAKAEYLGLQKQEDYEEKDIKQARDLLVSRLFELVSMYHEIGRDMEAKRVLGDIAHYDKSQLEFIENIKKMCYDAPAMSGMEPEERGKYLELVALTAAAGEGAYSRSEFGFE